MLELLIFLPFIMVSILSMTFQVSVDELSNASRGNYFRYDDSKRDPHSYFRTGEKIMYVSRIITQMGEEMLVPSFIPLGSCFCELTKGDCSSNQVLNPSTCRCEYQSFTKAENTRREPNAVGCNCICPLQVSQIFSADTIYHTEPYQHISPDSLSGSRHRRQPV